MNQESQRPSDQGNGYASSSLTSEKISSKKKKPKCGDSRCASGQAVHDIQEIDRIDQAYDPQDCYDLVDQ